MKYVSLCCALLFAWSAPLSAQEITNLNFLSNGGYTIIFRHASAPGGPPTAGGTGSDMSGPLDSLWWFRCDPNYSRQLNTVGRMEAIAIGNALRRVNARVSRIAASEFCRCYETATLMNLRLPITLEPGLTMTLYNDDIRRRGMDSLARPVPPAGTNTVLVTHRILFGDTLYNPVGFLEWSDAAVYQNRPNAQPQFVGFIRVATWLATANSRPTSVQTQQTPQTPLTEEALVSPNPATEMLTLRTKEPCSVHIINALGQTVYKNSTLQTETRINIEDWASAGYTIIFSNSATTFSRRFVKMQ